MSNSAIIVSAGLGTRMGTGVDKMFLEIAGCPIVGYTWLNYDGLECINDITLVVRPGREVEFSNLAETLSVKKKFQIVSGGDERQDSVWNGLVVIPKNTNIVVVQDGARPCTDRLLIKKTMEAAMSTGAAVAATLVSDTIKEIDGSGYIFQNLNRENLRAVQTPQTFKVDVLRRALTYVRDKELRVTDDTAACEFIGQPVALIESDLPNPKVTCQADLLYVKSLLTSQSQLATPKQLL